MSRDEEHLKLLSIFHFVVVGLLALFACALFLHLTMGVLILVGAFEPNPFGPPPRTVPDGYAQFNPPPKG